MSWYKTGTISVTNGSPTVTGVGTNFIEGANAGEAVQVDEVLYEILSIESATSLTLATNYIGSTQSGETYAIVPTQGLVANLATQVKDLITDYTDVQSGIIPTVKIGDGTASSPSLTFNNDQNNGLYKIGTDNWGMVAGGSKVVDVSTSGIDVTGDLVIQDTGFPRITLQDLDGTNTRSFIDHSGSDLVFTSQNNNANGRIIFNRYNNSSTATSGYFDAAGKLFINDDLDVSGTASMDEVTVSGGLDVDGTTNLDGVDIDGSVDISGNLNMSSSGLIRTTDGTEAIPGLRIGIDNDNGLYRPASNTIGFSTGGTERMRVDSTGLDVSGTATMDGLSVQSASESATVASFKGSSNFGIELAASGVAPYIQTVGVGSGEKLAITAGGDKVALFHDGGDISFYEDTGTTAKLFWDASAESLGIGTSSPSSELTIGADTPQIDLLKTSSADVLATIRAETDAGSGGKLVFQTKQNGNTALDRMTIDDDGNVGIGSGTAYSPFSILNGTDISMNAGGGGQFNITGSGYGFGIALDGVGAHLYTNSSLRSLIFGVNATERMRIDPSGHLLVGLSSTSGIATGSTADNGVYVDGNEGVVVAQASSNKNLYLSKASGYSDPDFISFQVNGASVGSIGTAGDALFISSPYGVSSGIRFASGIISPSTTTGANSDNTIDLGYTSSRFKDIYATNGTIQTSDAREKTAVRELTDAEMRVAKKLSKNIGFFQWLASVEEKGDDARLHCGQTVQSVIAEFEAEGLDAFDYAMICYNEWDAETVEHPAVEAVEAVDAVYDEEGELISEAIEAVEAADAWTEQTQEQGDRFSLRTDQLNHFMIRGLAQSQEALEARLSALEA